MDPVQARKDEQCQAALSASNTFEALANEWLEYNNRRWATSTAYKARLYLKNDLLPGISKRPVTTITRPELVDLLRRIEKRESFDAARKCRQWLNQIFRFGLAKGLLQYNPATDLDVVAAARPDTKHHPFVPASKLPALLNALEGYKGSVLTKLAVRLLILTAIRPGELRTAPWEEFDLDGAVWTIPASRMKMRRPHILPLPKQAVAIMQRTDVGFESKTCTPERSNGR